MQLLLLSIPDVKISLPDTENTVPDADITVSDAEITVLYFTWCRDYSTIPDAEITAITVPDADITVSDAEASKDVTVPSAELYYALDAEAVVVPAAEADARSVVVYLL